jgi:transposase
MPISPDTLLRLIRTAPSPDRKTPRVLGVDDWAKRKGHSYGTILVDLETRQPVDLLPSRRAETLAQWLREHPGVEIISRDRSTEYRKGATDGAPDATQVADRWHLLKNLREMLQRLLENKTHCLTAAADNEPPDTAAPEKPPAFAIAADTPPKSPKTNPPQISNPSAGEPARSADDRENTVEPATVESEKAVVPEKTAVCAFESSPAPQTDLTDKPPSRSDSSAGCETLTVAKKKKQAVHDRRQKRYQMVCSLHQQGLSQREIARRTKLNGRTVRKYINASQCPQYPEGVKRTSKIDPYVGIIKQRLKVGRHNAKTIFAECRRLGFDGSYELVARFCRKVAGRKSAPSAASASPQNSQKPAILPWSARRASWVLFKLEADLTSDEASALGRIKASDEAVADAHTLGQRFGQMIRQQDPSELLPWLSDVAQTGIDTLVRFADGIKGDLAAVTNALRLPWSQGQVEGQVNRLKLIKRQMYGRANLDLLRKRVLGCQTTGQLNPV